MKFTVITLCGSTKFKKEFEEVEKNFTLKGFVVFSCGVFGHYENIVLDEKTKELLDEIHRQKIDMSDEIFVINVNGYIGKSTSNEIKYAKNLGLPINYLEEGIQC